MIKEKLVEEAYNYAKRKKLDSINVIDAYIEGAVSTDTFESMVEEFEKIVNDQISTSQYYNNIDEGGHEKAKRIKHYISQLLKAIKE